jgi:hypothetical protein
LREGGHPVASHILPYAARPSSIVHRPSSIVDRQSSIVTGFDDRQSTIAERATVYSKSEN